SQLKILLTDFSKIIKLIYTYINIFINLSMYHLSLLIESFVLPSSIHVPWFRPGSSRTVHDVTRGLSSGPFQNVVRVVEGVCPKCWSSAGQVKERSMKRRKGADDTRRPRRSPAARPRSQERNSTGRRLLESEDRFRELVENANDAIALLS